LRQGKHRAIINLGGAADKEGQTVIAQEQIQEVARRLGEAADAERVILFGSQARQDAREDSDVDFLIVADTDEPRFRRSRPLYRIL